MTNIIIRKAIRRYRKRGITYRPVDDIELIGEAEIVGNAEFWELKLSDPEDLNKVGRYFKLMDYVYEETEDDEYLIMITPANDRLFIREENPSGHEFINLTQASGPRG